jgi:hypothetical protein
MGCGAENRRQVEQGALVTRRALQQNWPLTVDSGYVDCKALAAIFRYRGTEYALNGRAEAAGYANIEPIWAYNHEIPGARKPIGVLIDAAMATCR